MINIPRARLALEACQSARVAIDREQLERLYDAVEQGQQAQKALAAVAQTAVAATAAGMLA